MTAAPLFAHAALIGIGLIGSSLARRARRDGLFGRITAGTRTEATAARALELGIVDAATTDLVAAVAGADLVVLCTSVGAYGEIAARIGPHLSAGCVVTDVGSVKQAPIRDVTPHLPQGVAFVPGHPIAGTEHSGPDSGFAELFDGRWCILTPEPGTDPAAVARVRELWRRVGSNIDVMDAAHHDRALAITSHIPHLIAYNIVGTVSDLEEDAQREVIKYAASGFRDFTRIAASDPVMWRDVFLNNREAVLEMLQRFTEDLTALQRAIRRGDGKTLQDRFARTRAIRRSIIDAKQA